MYYFKISLKILVIIFVIYVSDIIALPTLKSEFKEQNLPKISGIKQMRILRNLLKECENSSPSNDTSPTWQCLKMTSLNIVDEMTRRQIIPLGEGVRFVKILNNKENKMSPSANENEFLQRKDLQYLTWFDRLALIFTKMLNTHMLEINLKELTEAYVDKVNKNDPFFTNNTDTVGTARVRRHRFNMMITMMFGVTALGAVLVPMGFQMLSVVSGKALLLAKMALLLASINGLKRVANSGVHYGLYHVPGEHYGNFYDRGDIHHPRNVPNIVPVTQPLEMGLTV